MSVGHFGAHSISWSTYGSQHSGEGDGARSAKWAHGQLCGFSKVAGDLGVTFTVTVPLGPTGTRSRRRQMEDRNPSAMPPVLGVQATLPAERGEALPGTIWCIPPRKK